MSTPEEIELVVLSSIKSIEDLTTLVEMGIADDSFQVEEHQDAWNYIVKSSAYGKLPSPADIKGNSGVELISGITDKETPAATLAKVSFQKRASNAIIMRSKELLTNPESSVRGLMGDLSELNSGKIAHTTYFDADANKRLTEIRERIELRKSGKMVGIPTGLAVFDENGDTWRPGELIVILGTTNVGKSWLLFYFCGHAYWYSNKRVLILSPEDVNFEVEARLDPIVGRFMGHILSNRQIRNGSIDQFLYERYIAELVQSGRKDLKVRDSGDAGVFTIPDIISQAREFRPDILGIDGFHLIKGVGKSWENIKEAAEQIKGQAQHMGITVIAGSQATRDAAMAIDDTPELGQAAYGMGLMEAANRVITLTEKRGDKKQRIFKVPKFRSGAEKITQRQYLNFEKYEHILQSKTLSCFFVLSI